MNKDACFFAREPRKKIFHGKSWTHDHRVPRNLLVQLNYQAWQQRVSIFELLFRAIPLKQLHRIERA